MIGDIYSSKTPVSNYQPSQAVEDLTKCVKQDFSDGVEILNHTWTELNDMSVIDRMNRDQRTFNAFVDTSVEDPGEAWKWRGTRSKARNKAIAMHANLTAGYIVPMFMAQNDASEEDRDFSDVMRDLVEWMVNNSNYKSSFLVASMGMLVNPVTYLGAEYAEVLQTIKVKTEEGYSKQEIIDEVLSGFQAPVYSADQILISNAHEQNIQRQSKLIKRRYIEYSAAKAKYGDHENFQYVQPGMKSVYSETAGIFYDVKDDEHPNLVEEAIWLCRREDMEVPFVGGVFMGVEDDKGIDNNPIHHRDNRNAPKYNVTPFGYQRINEHFFYYKSLMNAQYWDNQLLDAQYEVGMNRLFLDANLPIAISGADDFDGDIAFPGAVTVFKDKDAKVNPVVPQSNLGSMFAGIAAVEKSMDESSISDVTAGQLPDKDQLATSVSIAQQNAKIMLQGVGKTLAESIVQYGGLMSDIAIQHLTIPQVDDIVGDTVKIKYRSFVLTNKVVHGKSKSKILKFDESLLGVEMTAAEKKTASLKMLEDVGYPDNKQEIYRINPELFARMKYLSSCEPEKMFPRNEEFQQALSMQLLTQLEQNPFVSLEALTRKVVYAFYRGEADDIMKKQDPTAPLLPAAGGTAAGNQALQKATGAGLAGGGMS